VRKEGKEGKEKKEKEKKGKREKERCPKDILKTRCICE
jgi:hypothetical protein